MQDDNVCLIHTNPTTLILLSDISPSYSLPLSRDQMTNRLPSIRKTSRLLPILAKLNISRTDKQ